MAINQASTSELVALTPPLEARARLNSVPAQPGISQRLIVGAYRIQSSIGTVGTAALSSGIILALGCTLWAISLGVSQPLAIMVGYCAMVGSACLCTSIVLLRRSATKGSTIDATRWPNYAAWKLMSRLSVSDASRLWCDIEPGCAASQESSAWALAMLDAIKTGELPVSSSSGTREEVINQNRANPNWHTEVTRDALKAWARTHGHSPRFLEN